MYALSVTFSILILIFSLICFFNFSNGFSPINNETDILFVSGSTESIFTSWVFPTSVNFLGNILGSVKEHCDL